jgi:hypothetical protein
MDFENILQEHYQAMNQFQQPEDVIASCISCPKAHATWFRKHVTADSPGFTIHALFRKLCASSITSHGDSVNFISRLRHRYGDEFPYQDQILQDYFPNEVAYAIGSSFAIFDLYLMVFAASIYCDPLKIRALLPSELSVDLTLKGRLKYRSPNRCLVSYLAEEGQWWCTNLTQNESMH